MKCKIQNRVECGFWEAGNCLADIKCGNQVANTITNYDHIRNMSIEEMAAFIEDDETIFRYCSPEYCPHYEENGDCYAFKNKINEKPCAAAAKRWLESEAPDND